MAIQFVEERGAYTGSGLAGRRCRISRVFNGWRLEFRDDGDITATFAVVHRSVEASKA